MTATLGSRIDRILDDARSRLTRMSAQDVPAALARGAVLVDIRPQAQRDREGDVPAALVVERNVLEWRCDPPVTPVLRRPWTTTSNGWCCARRATRPAWPLQPCSTWGCTAPPTSSVATTLKAEGVLV